MATHSKSSRKAVIQFRLLLSPRRPGHGGQLVSLARTVRCWPCALLSLWCFRRGSEVDQPLDGWIMNHDGSNLKFRDETVGGSHLSEEKMQVSRRTSAKTGSLLPAPGSFYSPQRPTCENTFSEAFSSRLDSVGAHAFDSTRLGPSSSETLHMRRAPPFSQANRS